MKKPILTLIFLAAILVPAFAQFQANIQLGANYTKSSSSPINAVDTKGAYGFVFATDLRIGHRFYVQPGAYFSTSRTVYNVTDSLAVNRNRIDRYAVGAKLWAGFKIINTKYVKLRVALGPSYDYFVGTNVHDDIDFKKEDFNKGSFNLDGNVGVDIWRISFDVTYNLGLTKTFDADYFSSKPKYRQITLTVGYIIGRLGKKIL